MPATDNTESEARALSNPDGLTIGSLLGALAPHRDLPLTFSFGGRDIRPGYHVTEVKAGSFAALDCGANPESWTEIFVQLWDVDDSKVQMTAGKFAAIIRKVADHVALDQAARLTFEVSDGSQPMQLHKADAPTIAEGVVHVDLSPRAASCKPRDRWLVENPPEACCAAAPQPCCG